MQVATGHILQCKPPQLNVGTCVCVCVGVCDNLEKQGGGSNKLYKHNSNYLGKANNVKLSFGHHLKSVSVNWTHSDLPVQCCAVVLQHAQGSNVQSHCIKIVFIIATLQVEHSEESISYKFVRDAILKFLKLATKYV